MNNKTKNIITLFALFALGIGISVLQYFLLLSALNDVTKGDTGYFKLFLMVVLCIGLVVIFTVISNINVVPELDKFRYKFKNVSIITATVILLLSTTFAIINGLDTPDLGYVEGDYSEHTCALCDQPADGGCYLEKVHISRDDYFKEEYYCTKHYAQEKERYDKIANSNSSSGKSNFTNEYGNENTTCAVAGCNKKIASSGNTNCCPSHSNRCYECGCYIDGDAMMCMDCIEGALN